MADVGTWANWPTKIPANSDPVTGPRPNPAILSEPIQYPTRDDEEERQFRIAGEEVLQPGQHATLPRQNVSPHP